MTTSKSRTVPRAFELHWGGGVIAEEATYAGEHHEPAIQLLDLMRATLRYDSAGTTMQAVSSGRPSSLEMLRSRA